MIRRRLTTRTATADPADTGPATPPAQPVSHAPWNEHEALTVRLERAAERTVRVAQHDRLGETATMRMCAAGESAHVAAAALGWARVVSGSEWRLRSARSLAQLVAGQINVSVDGRPIDRFAAVGGDAAWLLAQAAVMACTAEVGAVSFAAAYLSRAGEELDRLEVMLRIGGQR